MDIDKQLLIVQTKIDINKQKNKFIDYAAILRDVYANILQESTEKDMRLNIRKLMDNVINMTSEFERYCENLHCTEIVDNIHKGTLMSISNVPIIQLEIEHVSEQISNIILIIDEIKKELRSQSNRQNKKLMHYI